MRHDEKLHSNIINTADGARHVEMWINERGYSKRNAECSTRHESLFTPGGGKRKCLEVVFVRRRARPFESIWRHVGAHMSSHVSLRLHLVVSLRIIEWSGFDKNGLAPALPRTAHVGCLWRRQVKR